MTDLPKLSWKSPYAGLPSVPDVLCLLLLEPPKKDDDKLVAAWYRGAGVWRDSLYDDDEDAEVWGVTEIRAYAPLATDALFEGALKVFLKKKKKTPPPEAVKKMSKAQTAKKKEIALEREEERGRVADAIERLADDRNQGFSDDRVAVEERKAAEKDDPTRPDLAWPSHWKSPWEHPNEGSLCILSLWHDPNDPPCYVAAWYRGSRGEDRCTCEPDEERHFRLCSDRWICTICLGRLPELPSERPIGIDHSGEYPEERVPKGTWTEANGDIDATTWEEESVLAWFYVSHPVFDSDGYAGLRRREAKHREHLAEVRSVRPTGQVMYTPDPYPPVTKNPPTSPFMKNPPPPFDLDKLLEQASPTGFGIGARVTLRSGTWAEVIGLYYPTTDVQIQVEGGAKRRVELTEICGLQPKENLVQAHVLCYGLLPVTFCLRCGRTGEEWMAADHHDKCIYQSAVMVASTVQAYFDLGHLAMDPAIEAFPEFVERERKYHGVVTPTVVHAPDVVKAAKEASYRAHGGVEAAPDLVNVAIKEEANRVQHIVYGLDGATFCLLCGKEQATWEGPSTRCSLVPAQTAAQRMRTHLWLKEHPGCDPFDQFEKGGEALAVRLQEARGRISLTQGMSLDIVLAKPLPEPRTPHTPYVVDGMTFCLHCGTHKGGWGWGPLHHCAVEVPAKVVASQVRRHLWKMGALASKYKFQTREHTLTGLIENARKIRPAVDSPKEELKKAEVKKEKAEVNGHVAHETEGIGASCLWCGKPQDKWYDGDLCYSTDEKTVAQRIRSRLWRHEALVGTAKVLSPIFEMYGEMLTKALKEERALLVQQALSDEESSSLLQETQEKLDAAEKEIEEWKSKLYASQRELAVAALRDTEEGPPILGTIEKALADAEQEREVKSTMPRMHVAYTVDEATFCLHCGKPVNAWEWVVLQDCAREIPAKTLARLIREYLQKVGAVGEGFKFQAREDTLVGFIERARRAEHVGPVEPVREKEEAKPAMPEIKESAGEAYEKLCEEYKKLCAGYEAVKATSEHRIALALAACGVEPVCPTEGLSKEPEKDAKEEGSEDGADEGGGPRRIQRVEDLRVGDVIRHADGGALWEVTGLPHQERGRESLIYPQLHWLPSESSIEPSRLVVLVDKMGARRGTYYCWSCQRYAFNASFSSPPVCALCGTNVIPAADVKHKHTQQQLKLDRDGYQSVVMDEEDALARGIILQPDDEVLVADFSCTRYLDGEERAANARLFVAAHPMLVALETCVAVLESSSTLAPAIPGQAALKAAKAAIALATETPS